LLLLLVLLAARGRGISFHLAAGPSMDIKIVDGQQVFAAVVSCLAGYSG